MIMSLSSALDKLATFRTNNSRSSQETFKNASIVLKSAKQLGDDGWAVLEQLFLASVDIGRLDVADECLKQLADRFPESPRVDVLTGIRMEATEPPDVVLQYYGQLLDAQSANAAIWKRKISVLRRTGKIEKAVEELSQLLDTFYTDVEGWLELADIYTTCNQYIPALQALSHVLLLAPQNPFYALQFAETAYTAGDLPLALKTFLVVVDMSERDLDSPEKKPPVGISVRAWLGIKLCSRRLMLNSSPSASNTPIPKSLNLIEELATERVLAIYSTKGTPRGKAAEGKDVIAGWISDR
ncbi:TPR-REGION domain-containing protein [Mycena sanguinolenta]|uniref:ER membrane protein complex subunit 2 n=1 Tax=Mycena sanguinolenta TaxID=230812 RepID=A0A8H6YWL0_9AGAR|nr:TPR-REGION domain-containing protein [Mycena sanguinolenta]